MENIKLDKPTFLFGRDRGIVDIVIEHPSCSKQHAVLFDDKLYSIYLGYSI